MKLLVRMDQNPSLWIHIIVECLVRHFGSDYVVVCHTSDCIRDTAESDSNFSKVIFFDKDEMEEFGSEAGLKRVLAVLATDEELDFDSMEGEILLPVDISQEKDKILQNIRNILGFSERDKRSLTANT